MPFFFKRHPRIRLVGTYVLILSLLSTYYVWQLTRDNTRVFIFEYEPNGGSSVDLAMALWNGQVSIIGSPEPKFAVLKNPYSPEERARNNVDFPWDFSYYRAPGEKLGKYYLYFQPGPVLLFYLPQYFLTGELPSQRWVMFLLSEISLLFYALFLRLLVRNYFPNVPLSLEALLLFIYGLCNMNNYLQVTSSSYEMAICSGTAFAMGCFLFLLLALESAAYRIVWLALAGICAGFAFGSRPTYVFLNILLGVTWLFLLWRKHQFVIRRSFIWESIALFLPVLLCDAASAWYNQARFGNIFEFGLSYQLNGGEAQRYKHFLVSYIPHSLWCYFLQPWYPTHYFPFMELEADDWYGFLWPNRFRNQSSGFLPAFPIVLLSVAWPFYIRAQNPTKRDHVRFLGLLLSLWTLIIITVLSMYFAVAHRYEEEIIFPLLLLTTLTLLLRRQAGPFRVWEKIVLFLLCAYSFYFGIVYGLTGTLHWVQAKLHGLYGWPYSY